MRARRLTRALVGLAAFTACAPAGAGPAPPSAELVPPGFGTLRQEEITLTLQDGAVQLKATPLEEWVLRLTAPDTYQRLSGLAEGQREAAQARSGAAEPRLWLVSFFSSGQGDVFHPEDLSLENRGRRFQALAILPLTGGWGTQRLSQRQTEMAVYAFAPDVDLDMELVVEYRGTRNAGWPTVLRTLEAERARARARAGIGTS